MKKDIKKLNIFKLLGLVFITVTIAAAPFFVSSINTLDKKVYYKGSINDNFADDTVIIVLNQEETHKFLTYTAEHFPEIDCVLVKDLTSHTLDYVKEQIENRNAGIESNEGTMLVNVDNYRRILSLKLAEKSKENVIRSIKLLEKRPEVVSAEPNSIISIDTIFYDSWTS